MISDSDLRELMGELDVKNQERGRWEDVTDKKNGSISYSAKCCRPQVGPLKYLSVTIFEKCSTELLRDFYMDNEYRKEWDKTLIEYKQLQADETSGTEIGSMIKKFPLLTPREYILAWRVWEGKDKTFYCIVKDCEHPLAPRQKKFVRVNFFRSGWRIRKVPGRDACEITMLHQEDAGLNVEMAKLAFARGIWSYVCKMNNALREYSSPIRSRSTSVATMLRLIKKVPDVMEMDSGTTHQILPDIIPTSSNIPSKPTLWQSPSKKKLIANGLLLLGGIACLSRGRTTLGTQLAMACILKKFMKRGPTSDSGKTGPARIPKGKRSIRHRD
ncbi:phosphatidylcholine transfer protein-like [Asparagus officinalis]|nr:phosphatidylcholine transfer protein-like [Asparagus officinalis]